MITMKSFNWKTNKGFNLEVKVEINHVTKEIVEYNGTTNEVECSKWFYEIAFMTINGEEPKKYHLYKEEKKRYIMVENDNYIESNKYKRILFSIPKRVQEEMYKEENEENK